MRAIGWLFTVVGWVLTFLAGHKSLWFLPPALALIVWGTTLRVAANDSEEPT